MTGKPLIRWAGSKRKLLPTLLQNIPDKFDRYVEPFCGSACLFFALNPDKAILSDLNTELINALKEIKSNKNIRSQLIEIPNSKDEYYRLRKLDTSNLDPRERAIRFLYLNRYCFNGVYRTNMSGQFNVPRGTKTGDFPSKETFDLARKKLRIARLVACDYKSTLKQLKEGDFVYLDPPYSDSHKFTGEYGPGSFEASELPALFKLLEDLDRKSVKFLLSYRACGKTTQYLKHRYQLSSLSVKRHVAGFKSGWMNSEEILVKNYG